MLTLACLLSSALAGEYYLELPGETSRRKVEADGDDVTSALGSSADAHPPRVVRRYEHGAGWTYLVVVEGYEDAEQARADASVLAQAGYSAVVYERDGTTAQPIAMTSANPGALESVAEDGHSPRLPADDAVLRAAVKAHGGRGGGLARLAEAQTVRFAYDRVVKDGGGLIVAGNTYNRSGDAIQLSVVIEQGEGKSSDSGVDAEGHAWVTVDGATTERDGLRTRQVLERFSPESVLAIPLGLPDDVETATAWRELMTAGTSTEGNRQVVVLAPPSTTTSGLVLAAFDSHDHTLVRVTWSAESGDTSFFYDDYRKVEKGLVVPFFARVERNGELVEEIKVDSLALDLEIPGEIFKVPTAQ